MPYGNNGGYPPPPPYPQYQQQSQQPGISAQSVMEENRRLKNEFDDLKARYDIISKMGQYPEQILHAGTIAYPDRKPFTMVLRDEILEPGRVRFGTTGAISNSSYNVDVDNPTYLTAISFAGIWTAHENAALVNAYFPFKMPRQDWFAAAADTFPGISFEWRVLTSADDRQWQAAGPNVGGNWRDSSDLDDDGFYYLPLEYEFVRNDTVIIEAQPFAANAEGNVSRLFASLHIYKMCQPLQKIF